MIILTQKSTLVNDKLIAYVDITLKIDKYTYGLTVNKKQKAYFNNYLRSLGFVVGVVETTPTPKTVEIKN